MLHKLGQRLGILPATLIITQSAILISLGVSIALAVLFGEPLSPAEFFAALIIPSLLVPWLCHTTLTQMADLAGKAQAAQILAITDPATESFNRRYMTQAVEKEIALAQRYGDKFSFLLIDIDHLQGINNTYSYATGDLVLKTVSELCQAQMRCSDILGRLGGDEFACLLPRTLNSGALEFSERLRQIVAATPLMIDNDQVHFTISIGVKTLGEEKTWNAVLHAAYNALGIAKNRGKNQCVSAELGLLPQAIEL